MHIRPSAVVTLVYLVLMLPLAVLGREGGQQGNLFLAGHILATAVMAVAARVEGSGNWRLALDWAPMAAIPFLYSELPLLMAGSGAGFHDAMVQRWEAALFGASPALTLADALPFPWVSEPLHLAYLSYYAIIYVPAAVLAVSGRRHDFLVMTSTVLLAFVACFAIFAVFPVQGPRYLWSAASVPDGPVRSIVVALLEQGSSRGAAFPSSHVAVAVVQSVLAVRYRLPAAWLIAFLTLGLAAGAVYGGFHYAVDAVAGVLLGAAVLVVAPWVMRRVSPLPHSASGPRPRA